MASRIATLKKKASELSTLCGVSLCFVCIMPDGSVFTWPENHSEVRSTLHRYQLAAASGAAAEKKPKRRLCDDASEPSVAKKRKLIGDPFSPSSTLVVPVSSHPPDDVTALLTSLDCKLQNLNDKIRVLEKEKEDELNFCEELQEWIELDDVPDEFRVSEGEFCGEAKSIALGHGNGDGDGEVVTEAGIPSGESERGEVKEEEAWLLEMRFEISKETEPITLWDSDFLY